MEHLALEVFDRTGTGSKYATLPPNTVITITDTSEIFGSGDVWSYTFTLNIPANLHIFGTAGELHGARLHEQVDKLRARLWVEGLPLYMGYLKLEDEVDVDNDGNIDVKFWSGQKTFEELIEGGKANQVPIGDVKIGLAKWRKRIASFGLNLKAYADFDDGSRSETVTVEQDVAGRENTPIEFGTNGQDYPVSQYPRLVFPRGNFIPEVTTSEGVNPGINSGVNFDFLNTDQPYDNDHPYCNIALCYQKRGYPEDQNGNVDYSQEPEAKRSYEIMPANRVNSAPCFYVLYWIKQLMKYLGIYIEENQMLDIEDMKRLFFVNTNCDYELPERLDEYHIDERYGCYRLNSGYLAERIGDYPFINISDENGIKKSAIQSVNIEAGEPIYRYEGLTDEEIESIPDISQINVNIDSIAEWAEDAQGSNYKLNNNLYHWAYATSKCFPNVEISTVINALKNGFGMRMLFDDNYQRVRIVLLRNIFRNTSVQDIACDIVDEDEKVENNIRGFRMTYGQGTESTDYYYKGFADLLPSSKKLWIDNDDTHDYSKWNTNATYAEIINGVSSFDKTCYVTPNNGNAYGIKIDKDAKMIDDLHPSLFEYATFMDAEDGDCTGDEGTIEEINVGFTPIIMNDVNIDEERTNFTENQRFALFVDEQMQPRRFDLGNLTPPVSYNDPDVGYDTGALYTHNELKKDGEVMPGRFAIMSDTHAYHNNLKVTITKNLSVTRGGVTFIVPINWNVKFGVAGHVTEGYALYLQDNYTPNDDGISPIETHDWGLALGIMRGNGSDAHVVYENDPQDEENNTWYIASGSSETIHADTCDNYGNKWNYSNVTLSLKLRAEKPNPSLPYVVTTKEEAGRAMTSLYRTANCDLLSRQGVEKSTMRMMGWDDCTGDGYVRVFGMIYNVEYSDGSVHQILWTPIKPNGGIKTPEQLQSYISGFNGLPANQIISHDTDQLILDVDTTENRAEILHKLQAIYYEIGDSLSPVTIYPEKYLEITNLSLRRRGLCDQFYSEYSYWVRNARILKRPVKMGIAQLLAIDKTVKARVGDVTGFIKSMQYTVSNETGLGTVVMELMYI